MDTIPNWPAQQRPREKLLSQGAQQLSDTELLAIFLRVGIPGKTAVDLARDMLHHFGGLRQLMEAELDSFCQLKGLGPAKYIQLQAVLELSKRYLQTMLHDGDAIHSATAATDYLAQQLRPHPHEVFACLFLNAQHKLIKYEELFYGTINSSSVHPRVVAQKSLKYNAAAVILAHNHPSGEASPSTADQQITQTLIKTLELLDVTVLDHIIIGDTQHFSFANAGLLHTT